MIPYDQIREVHLELSTLCNAICPECPRNFHGYPHNDGYPETNLTLDHAQKIFTPEFLRQINRILVNGNFGDFVMNPESLEILKYFKSHNPDIRIVISTNGGARSTQFWQELALLNPFVYFCIDGLEDTHHLYRQNTIWKTVIRNAEVFMAAGGKASWKMIRFKHNEAQIDECLKMAKDKGFVDFQLIDHGRNTGPVFDKNGKITHILGDYRGSLDLKIAMDSKLNQRGSDRFKNHVVYETLDCESKKQRQIYITATGEVYPCCYLGFYPQTYGLGSWIGPDNEKISVMSKKNSAIEYGIQGAMSWFSEIEKAWGKKTLDEGRIGICDRQCGRKLKNDRSLYES